MVSLQMADNLSGKSSVLGAQPTMRLLQLLVSAGPIAVVSRDVQRLPVKSLDRLATPVATLGEPLLVIITIEHNIHLV